MLHILGAPLTKKLKVEKKSKAEKAIERAVTSFMKYQSEMDERFQKAEEERWKRETELEEKRRKDEREHEIRMLQMLGQMIAPRERAPDSYRTFPPPHSQAFNYDYDNY